MAAKPDLRWIRRRLERVRVHSCSDGTFGIEARWKEPFAYKADEEASCARQLPPGMFTRMDTAEELERILNAALGVPVNGE